MATPLISFDGTEFDKIKNDPDAYIGRLDKPYQLKRALEICRKFDRSGVYVSKVQDRARDLGIILNAVTSTNAVVAKALNACGAVKNDHLIPPDLWEKLYKTEFVYTVLADLKRGVRIDDIIQRFKKSGPGSNIPRRSQDSATVVSVLEEMKKRGINACGTARNASGHKVKVTIKSITDKGIQTFEKIVDVDGLESWMRSAGLGGEYQHVLKQLAAMGVNEVSLSAMSKVMIADV